MTTNYFHGCITVQDVKKRYKDLAKQFHPDLGGDVATMQEINGRYEQALSMRDGATYRGSDGENHEYKFNVEVERAIMEKLAEIYACRLGDNVEIALAGTWLWVTGDTKPVKDKLKELGFRFAPKKVAWSWHNGKYFRRHGGQEWSMDDIARAHGFTVMSRPGEKRLSN